MENSTLVHKAIKSFKTEYIPGWLSCLATTVPIYCLWGNLIAPDKLFCGGILSLIAVVLWWFMVREDGRTNMIDIRQAALFLFIMLYLAQDNMLDAIKIFICWLFLYSYLHTGCIAIDVLRSKYHSKKKPVQELHSAVAEGPHLPLLPALTGSLWLYSMILIAISYTADLEIYNILCNRLSNTSRDIILNLPQIAIIIMALAIMANNHFIKRKLIKSPIYKDTAVEMLQGFIAPADIILLAVLTTFLQQAHFSMVIILLPICTRMYMVYKKRNLQ